MAQITLSPQETQLAQTTFITKVYGWMGGALLLTGIVAFFTAASPVLFEAIIGNRILFYALLFGELGLVWYVTSRIDSLSGAAATVLFLTYSVLNGLTLSVIFMAYTASSIGSTFFVTAATFGVMSLYGYTTKRDLTSIGNLLFMALIGLVIASVVNMFLNSEMVYWITTYAGILIFVGLTAYDTQKIKGMALADFGSAENVQKGALMGALSLYLDFINLFLFLLRLFGRRR
jgi:FtsH-binding integral membrane protein